MPLTLHHPFIEDVYCRFQCTAGRADATAYCCVKELLQGGDVASRLSKQGRLVVEETRFYVAQIGLALHYCHQHDLVLGQDFHMDSLLLDELGNIKLTDVAELRRAGAAFYGAASMDNTFSGRPEYLAPEFLKGIGVSRAVDYWTLGILLYEMLCGIPPFYNDNMNQMYEDILKKPLDFGDSEDCFPAAAMDLCTKLLDRDTTSRLQTFKALQEHPFFEAIDFDALLRKRLVAPLRRDRVPLWQLESVRPTRPIIPSLWATNLRMLHCYPDQYAPFCKQVLWTTATSHGRSHLAYAEAPSLVHEEPEFAAAELPTFSGGRAPAFITVDAANFRTMTPLLEGFGHFLFFTIPDEFFSYLVTERKSIRVGHMVFFPAQAGVHPDEQCPDAMKKTRHRTIFWGTKQECKHSITSAGIFVKVVPL